MQNIDVRFNATSNFGKVKADLAALQAQAAALGNVFASGAYATPPELVNTDKWRAASRAVHEASNVYRAAASSSGLLTTQQIRATSEAERYTKSLQKQKLALSDMRKHSGIMKQVYADQLRMQRMTAQYWGTDSAGRAITDIAIPKNVPRDLDTTAQKLYFTGQMAKSAGTQIVNMGKNLQWAGRQLTVGFTYPVALFGAAAGVMAYKVDEAMTQVTKVYDVSAEAQRNEAKRVEELNNVRIRSYEIAEQSAKRYGQSIEDTLGVEQALAATGLSGDKLFESTDAVGRIAALGDLDLTASTDMTVALQTAFKDTIRTTDDLNEAFNYMNAVENATSLSIKDIAEATPRAASAMSALGVSVEEMTVLLTSMREAGVNAAEGANALKSATGTILSPSPAAIKFIEEIGGPKLAKGMANLRETTGGNLYRAIEQIYSMTQGLSDDARQAVIVKMFGKYQFNRVSAMVENLGAAFDGTENQARKAMELMGEESETLADRAQKELDEKMTAASGRFKAAWQVVRIELAKLGVPFLELATKAAELGGKVLEFFNGMSDWKKKAVLGVAAIMALAGPVVMLGGLFMNLGGQFLTGAGRLMSGIGRLGGAFGLITKEEQAATLSAEAQNAAMQKQSTTTSTLAQEINVLTAAYEKATTAAKQYAIQQGVVSAAQQRTVVGPHAAPIGPQLPPVTGPVSYSYPRGASAADKSAARDAAYRSAQMSELKRIQAQEAINQKAAKEAALREKISNSINGAAIGTGVMAASMATMMLTSNETANNIAKWAMIGTIAAPALQMVVGLGNNLVGSLGSAITNARNAAAGMTAMGTAMNVAKAGAIGFGTALNAALGPVGWIALGLTAVAGVFMTIKSHNDKIKAKQEELLKKQLEANKVMLDTSASIATNMGKTAGSYQQITNAGGAAMGGTSAEDNVLKSYSFYKEDDEGKQMVTTLQTDDGKLKDTDELMNTIRTKFIDLQVIGSNTAKQAKQEIQGMLLAAGMGAAEAQEKAQELYKTYGDVSKIDWSEPIKDQAAALSQMASEAFGMQGQWNTYVGAGGYASTSYSSDFEVDEGKKKLLYQQAERSAEIFNQALANAANPREAREIIDQYMGAATSAWDSGFDSLMASTEGGSDKVKDLFKKYGIESGEEFAAAMREDGGFEKAYDDLISSQKVNVYLQDRLEGAKKFAIEYEHAFINPLAESSWYLSDSVLTAATALKQFNAAGIGLSADQATDKFLEESETYKEYAEMVERLSGMKYVGDIGLGAVTEKANYRTKEYLELQGKVNKKNKELTKQINELNQVYGFKQGRNATQALNFLLNQTKDNAKNAGKEVDGINNKLKQMPTRQTVTIQVKQVGGIVQTAMGNIQQRMADSAMTQFNERWDNTMATAQDTWDARQDGLAASHEAAMSRLERGQENAQEAFDRRWEKRREAIEKEYEKKINRVNREIEAEQKADEIRQRLFEKEKERLSRLAELQNTDIDFNTALNEGRLDDAAKTLNNAGVESGNAQMDAEAKAAEARTAARIKALEKKNERLEKARDKELKNLEKLEERMRKHLERVQEARRKALEKQQADEVKALERSEEAAMKSLDRQRKYEEATLQQRLDLFLAYTARNKKDLERWMRELGFEYDDFGDNVEKKGKKWSKTIRTSLLDEIREAGTKVMNDNLWERVGESMGKKLVKGLGFANMAEFRKFVSTGKMGGGKKKKDDTETQHTGGLVGSGNKNRGNIPNTYKGLHRSEQMVRAQKGEYVINKKATEKHRDIIEKINSGNFDREGNRIPGTGGEGVGFGGPGALMAGAVAQMFKAGTEKGFQRAYQRGLAKQAARRAAGSTYGAPKPGQYGDTVFNAEQLRNAAIIASTASKLGASQRDIQIALMTAMQESTLRNLDWGDRDSVGLFQQRDAWGSFAARTNPVAATKMFFQGGAAGQRGLFDFPDRGSMSLAQAAQAVQVSAYPDAYAKWANEASAIMKAFKNKGGGVTGPGGSKGSGKYWRASDPGKGWRNSHDYGNGLRSPVYAIGPGTVRTVQLPPSAGSGQHPEAYPRGYGSYGVVSYLTTDDGKRVTYAHLYPGTQVSGRVSGGQRIALSASTGNSSGPHTHFEVNGSTNAQGAFAAMGIPLRTGGTIKYDNTPANLHKGETVLTAPLTQKFKDAVGGLGSGDTFHVTLDLRGAMIKEDVDIEKAVNKAIDARENKLGRKRVVR